ncbi:hypothetical protein acsn021_07540 [Anaerocolumna cellulosilytica]|uniref:Regulatory protein MsrR n=1 Tax=Anaerocolumna cellulosilytica TaxID=433286 RepID=A0A6S6R0R1_9FIRM|nr:M56 family metallopeptidase [Anaerocolumna cellulosilytica]MBB5197874.1 LCP family protein required for cell wall assembly [Anaerocolumna cellulosilytica]BCJ93185.1 hypothetical protein acsn021_07540 [Anaerocolumna cellulosilytica]
MFLTIVSLSVVCSFIIGCVVLIDKIYKKNYSRQWIYITWAVIAIRLIIPVNLGIIEAPVSVNTNMTFAGFNASVEMVSNESFKVSKDANLEQGNNIITESNNTEESSIPSAEFIQKADSNKIDSRAQYSFSIRDSFTFIWVTGFIVFLLYHLTAYVYLKVKLRRWCISCKDEKIVHEFQTLCIEMGITHKINLLICNQVKSPILIGIIKPCIILPTQEFTLEQYRFILKHELIHYKHHDLLYKFILLLANAVHWFNPFVHYMVYLANNVIELYCDERLIAGNNLSYRENYSKTILQIMTGTGKKDYILLSTGFSSRKKQLKNRFYQIMNSKPSKKGVVFVVSMICLILVAGNVMAWFLPVKNVNADRKGMLNSAENITTLSNLPQDSESVPEPLEKVNNILVVGIDGNNTEDYLRADSILMVSINPDTKKVFLTSFLRDIYVEIPQQGKHKLSMAFELGGTNLIKNTLEENFGITIDHTMTIQMKVFEDIINSIGGVRITLTEKEADFLNTTNYITEKKNRNVIAGEQILNGNQALGYVRVSKVPTLQGEQNDLGRTLRLKEVVLSVIEDCSKKDIKILTQVATDFISIVSADLRIDKIIECFNLVMEEDVTIQNLTIPVKDSYTQNIEKGRIILDIDLKVNRKELEQINQ